MTEKMQMAIEYRDILLEIKDLESQIFEGIEAKIETVKPIFKPEQPVKKWKKIDRGKVKALWDAGRTVKWIADDLHCSEGTIYKIIDELKNMEDKEEIK